MKTIYIQLLDEGTSTFRPTQGIAKGGNDFQVLATPDYNSEDETWEFVPGSTVVCEKRNLSGGVRLVAYVDPIRL